MTIKEIENLETDFLTVQQVAECLHASPQLIRDQAEREIKWLGFPVCKFGHSFRIPREGFLTWARGKTPTITYPTGFSEMVKTK